MKRIVPFIAVAAIMSGFFMNYDVHAERDKERARIEAIQASTDYQVAKAAQFAKWGK